MKPISRSEPNAPPDTGRPAARSRVLLCGVGPVPLGPTDRLYAPGLRLWAFSRALLAAECAVDLLEVEFGREAAAGAGGRCHTLRLVTREPQSGLWGPCGRTGGPQGERLWIEAESVALDPAPPHALVERRLAAGRYDAVVSTTDVMNAACARACGSLPFWADFNGHCMAERQSQAHRHGSDAALAAQWDYILGPLLRADRLSSCSAAQRLAMLGELGACGRLNRLSDGERLVAALPPAVLFTDFPGTGERLRGKIAPEDAFIVLWTGGYNTWADPETLAGGLIEAMHRCEHIHYVSTGGAIAGHDERTFARFREIVDASSVADRFHFAGWVATRAVADYYRAADLAVNCDRATLDTELGWRNRIQEWVCAGAPVLSTNLCELTRDLASQGLIETFAPGEPSALADALERAAKRPSDESRQRAARARAYLLDRYQPEALFAELTAWALEPRRAADLGDEVARVPGVPFDLPANELALRRAREWREAWSEPAKSRCRCAGWMRRFGKALGFGPGW